MSHLLRWNESDDCLQSHSACCYLTTRLDNEEIQDGILSRMNEAVKHLDEVTTEIIRRVEESRIETRNSIANLNQCVKVLKERHSKQGTETSCSWDGWSQTCHTRDDELVLSHQKDLHPAREGHEQDGQMHRLSNEPDDRSQRLSPQHSQRNLNEETLVDVMVRSWWEAKRWEQLENDTAKCHRKALDHTIQAAEEAVEYAKTNNFSRQEVIDAENELAKAVQAKNSQYQVQKAGLNAKAHITSPTTRLVEPTFNPMMNVGDPQIDMEQEIIHYHGWFRPWRVWGLCSRHFEVAQNELFARRDQHRHAGWLPRHLPYRWGARMVLQECRMIQSPGPWLDLGNGSAGTTEEVPAYLDTPPCVK